MTDKQAKTLALSIVMQWHAVERKDSQKFLLRLREWHHRIHGQIRFDGMGNPVGYVVYDESVNWRDAMRDRAQERFTP